MLTNANLVLFAIANVAAISTGHSALDPFVANLVAKTPDSNQQRQLLEVLPRYIEQPAEWNALLDHLDLKYLDESDCRLMVRTLLRLEEAYDRHPQLVRPVGRGGRAEPQALIAFRIKILVIPNVVAFDEALLSGGEVGPLSEFLNTMLKWTAQHGIGSEAVSNIRDELAVFRASRAKADEVRMSLPTPPANASAPTSAKSQEERLRNPISQADSTGRKGTEGGNWRLLTAVFVLFGALLLWLRYARK